jgi:hypothetical protein
VRFDAAQDADALPPALAAHAGSAAMVYVVNLCHISPWEATEGLLRAAATLLRRPDGRLVIYGPFKVDGEFTVRSDSLPRPNSCALGLPAIQQTLETDEGRLGALTHNRSPSRADLRALPRRENVLHKCNRPGGQARQPGRLRPSEQAAWTVRGWSPLTGSESTKWAVSDSRGPVERAHALRARALTMHSPPWARACSRARIARERRPHHSRRAQYGPRAAVGPPMLGHGRGELPGPAATGRGELPGPAATSRW